ncbi:MAG TPA: hypothetical protein VJR03_16775 [Nitrospira sp.]|nr:hypothetical protein [Nitrospira sp.]
MKPFAARPAAHASPRWGISVSADGFITAALILILTGCGSSGSHYALIDKSLLANDYRQADSIVQNAEQEQYGPKSRVLYGMDRGMTLQLAGEYQQSNEVLEQAEDEVDRLYTRSVRTESLAFMTNDNSLPFEGEPYEQIMINVLKALNYACLNRWQDALVEARRIDHRLNVLADRITDKGAYHDDGFARYLSGILYETAGDMNNAFIAYRNAYETFEASRGWSRTNVPTQLRADLLRTADALHLSQEFAEYQHQFPDAVWKSSEEQQQLAQVLVISYNGRAPLKEDQFLDLPISTDALALVLVNRGFTSGNRQQQRAADSVLYGLNGRVVRVALPKIVPQKTHVPVDTINLTPEQGPPIIVRTELAQNITALADKALSERIAGIAVKAVARAAFKYTMAEGASRGAQHAVHGDAAPLVGLAVGLLAKGFAVASEEADKRSWRTLPDEIHVARTWVSPGAYHIGSASDGTGAATKMLSLRAGETSILIQRVVQ